MRRSVAVSWHAVSFVVAAGLYFLFVLPRWWELSGSHISHAQGTALRIVTGVVLALTALPVFFTLRHTRRPEFGTPQLALSLRIWSIVGHVLAGVLVVGTAISEIWLSLDKAGSWLFGIYGAAAAIAVLAAIAFYVAFAAERPPAPPKPLKAKKTKRVDPAEAVVTADDEADEEADEESGDATDEPEPDTDTGSEIETETDESEELELVEQAPRRGLRNKRPAKLPRD